MRQQFYPRHQVTVTGPGADDAGSMNADDECCKRRRLSANINPGVTDESPARQERQAA